MAWNLSMNQHIFPLKIFEWNGYTIMSLKAVEKTLFDNNCQGIGNYNVNN